MTNDVRGLLMRKWVKGIQRTLVAAANKDLVPKADDLPRMISFFNTVAARMEQNLETIFHASVQEYLNFILCKMVSPRRYYFFTVAVM